MSQTVPSFPHHIEPAEAIEGLLSVVIPLYREVDNVGPLVTKLEEVFSKLGHAYELILVDDGSDDGTGKALEALRASHPTLRPIYHRRNYGQSAALTAGFEAARGEFVITLDGDLQNDPADIPAMLEMVKSGQTDVACGWRQERKDNAAKVTIPSMIGNWIIRRMTKVHMHDYGCSLRVIRREFVEGLTIYGELHRFIPVLLAQQGARLKEVPVRHHARVAGVSKYNISKAPRVLLDLILMFFFQKFATRPIQFFGGLGLITGGLGGLILVYLTILKLFWNVDIGGRPALLLGILGVLVGVIFISIGLCAELIVRVYFEATGKKVYTTKLKP